jgi:hypothetical protein
VIWLGAALLSLVSCLAQQDAPEIAERRFGETSAVAIARESLVGK